jgi:hypothetical protein
MKKLLIIFLMLIAGTAWAYDDFMPTMTANNVPYNAIIPAFEYSGYEGYLLFDNSVVTNAFHGGQAGDGGYAHATEVVLTFTHTIYGYTITADATDKTKSPTGWNIMGSADSGTHWTQIDTQTGVTWASNGEKKTFILASPMSVNAIDFIFTAGGVECSVQEMELLGTSYINLMSTATDDGVYALYNSTPVFITDTTAYVGADSNYLGQITALTFSNITNALKFAVTIPKGATINSAYISLWGSVNPLFDDAGMKAAIYLENNADPATWSDVSNFTTRYANLVSGSVDWSNASINHTGRNNTPDLKSLVQTLVNSSAVSGLAFFIAPISGCADPAWYIFNTSTNEKLSKRPMLYVDYTEAAPSGGAKQQIMMMW